MIRLSRVYANGCGIGPGASWQPIRGSRAGWIERDREGGSNRQGVMRVVIACGGSVGFPKGSNAPVARLNGYARGLVEQNCRVTVLLLSTSEASEMDAQNTELRGIYKEIEFEYTCGATIRGDTFIKRRWHEFVGPILAGWRILQQNRSEHIDALILIDPGSLLAPIWLKLITVLCGCNFIYDRSEQPFLQSEKMTIWRLYAQIYTHTIFKFYDGMIVISDYLLGYMATRIRSGVKMIKIPIIVDIELFSSPANLNQNDRYITYCGTLNEAKDGVHTLMRAFAMISREFPSVKLNLVGDDDGVSQIQKFRSYAQELDIGEKVIFSGKVPRESIPQYLAQASVLALARPASIQASAGLPTKVGEYLASGKPVLVTRTGELGNWLEDGVNVYFAPPDDASAYADRLRYIFSHLDEAKLVGERGQRVAQQHFDYRVQGKRLKEFLESISKGRS
jgi:glycosyltransferase involved in cell wall biosynthesis